MINSAKTLRLLSLNLAVAGFILIGGSFTEANAQSRDPFAKPGWARTREVKPGSGGSGKGTAAAPNFAPPSVEQRIEFYKRQRENAAAAGMPIPKVTSVLTLDEMAVTGIFRTPRGYAAMVEATPIKLSYTIYPGEKFFDGQLVAVEENRLVFRKVTKVAKNKFVTSVENKALRQYTDKQVVQGTAPTQTAAVEGEPAPVQYVQAAQSKPASTGPIVSPLDEMEKQEPAKPAGDKSKSTKKPVKVARKK
jgi:hypothetical protein